MKLNRDVLRKLPLALQIEIEENAQRKALTQSELAAEQLSILAALRKFKAPGTRTDLTSESTALQRGGLFEKPVSEVARATGIVGQLYGESHKQVERRQAVVAAGESEPEKFGKLVADMDRTGRVNGVYRRLKIAKQAERIRAEPPPLPGNGPYRVAVIDFPWPYEVRSEDPSVRGVRPYPTMALANIFAFPVASIMHADSILWVWTTNLFMRHVYTALDAFGFEERTNLTWDKGRFGNGDWLRGQTEHCVMAVRGKPVVTLTSQSTLLRAPWRGHSIKPVEFYSLVESLCPAPRYADLFSRYRHNDKWDCHGDEAPEPPAAAEPYDGADDFTKSIAEGFRVIRERVAAGGKGWTPREVSASEPQTAAKPVREVPPEAES
jgi:N6-adenosine-specific RNA methylase IME4